MSEVNENKEVVDQFKETELVHNVSTKIEDDTKKEESISEEKGAIIKKTIEKEFNKRVNVEIVSIDKKTKTGYKVGEKLHIHPSQSEYLQKIGFKLKQA